MLAASKALPAYKNDLSFWTAAVSVDPTPYSFTGLARVHSEKGEHSNAALLYTQALQVTGGPNGRVQPFSQACYSVVGAFLAASDPRSAAQQGLNALEIGCERSPELVASTAVALVLTDRWDEGEALAKTVVDDSFRGDPTGRAVVVIVAAAALKGDMETLVTVGGDDIAGLAGRVSTLLELADQPVWAKRVAGVPKLMESQH